MVSSAVIVFFFFFNDTATTEIYTLSLHDALPISASWPAGGRNPGEKPSTRTTPRSEEHTSELQSQSNIVCRLLLEKKNKTSQFPRCSRIFYASPIPNPKPPIC